jgi:hypothetical protein
MLKHHLYGRHSATTDPRRLAVDENPACRWALEPGDKAGQRALPCPALTHNGQGSTGRKFERDIAEDGRRPASESIRVRYAVDVKDVVRRATHAA